MAKGFTIPVYLRGERDGTVSNPSPDLERGETNEKFAWAVAHKPGMVPINGGQRRLRADFQRGRARLWLQNARRRTKRAHLSRYTPPKPRYARQPEPETTFTDGK